MDRRQFLQTTTATGVVLACPVVFGKSQANTEEVVKIVTGLIQSQHDDYWLNDHVINDVALNTKLIRENAELFPLERQVQQLPVPFIVKAWAFKQEFKREPWMERKWVHNLYECQGCYRERDQYEHHLDYIVKEYAEEIRREQISLARLTGWNMHQYIPVQLVPAINHNTFTLVYAAKIRYAVG